MKVLTFDKPEHFKRSLSDDKQLAAFALGAQSTMIHHLIHSEEYEGVPNDLATQKTLEKLARQLVYNYKQCPERYRALKRYKQMLVDSELLMCDDIELHLKYPALTLAKYYYCLQQSIDKMDSMKLWERHLRFCKALCFALNEYYAEPRSLIEYRHNMVQVEHPHQRQSYCYIETKVPICFHAFDYRLFQLPLPWSQ
ncbi:hypothetical protein ACPV52_17115 [Vibrio astriarenae]